MNNKHYPGPWSINENQKDCGEDKISIEAEGEYFIAQVDAGLHQYANARLIAAAPDLLAALIEARESVRAHRDEIYEGHYRPHIGDVSLEDKPLIENEDAKLRMIDAAIAKATGAA